MSALGESSADGEESVRVFGALSELARAATDVDVAVADVLRRLCLLAPLGVDVDGVGVMLADAESVRFLHAEPRPMIAVERLQEQMQLGPCIECLHGQQAVVVDDVTASGRWVPLTARAVWAGVRSVLAMPLLAGGQVLGVLDLYRSRVQPWSSRDLAVAGTFADVAASYVALAAGRDDALILRRRLEHQVNHDELTGLPNRRLLFDRIEHAMLTAIRHGRAVGVMFVDIDGFKDINDTMGHAFGDLVLAEVARRLRLTLRASDTLARLSGDEFVVICEDLAGSPAQVGEWLHALGRRIQIELRQPPRGAEVEVVVSVSIGAAITSQPRTAQDLLAEADHAMYRAKKRGGGRLVIGTPDAVRPAGHPSGRRRTRSS